MAKTPMISCCQLTEMMRRDAARPWLLRYRRPWVKAWDWLAWNVVERR
jgi:hypothetical protein